MFKWLKKIFTKKEPPKELPKGIIDEYECLNNSIEDFDLFIHYKGSQTESPVVTASENTKPKPVDKHKEFFRKNPSDLGGGIRF